MNIITAVRNIIKRELFRDPFLLEVKRWFRDHGDKIHRLVYPLNKNSIVLDIGGFHGDFASAIYNRYGCKILLFEPHTVFYESCIQRFKEIPEIQCFNYGLGSWNGVLDISDHGDASSFLRFSQGQQGQPAAVRSIADVWRELHLDTVDLIKINIEGGEYDVIPALIDSGLIQKVRFLQVQFHNFIDNAVNLRRQIRSRLTETHDEMWNYEFVWESWRQK